VAKTTRQVLRELMAEGKTPEWAVAALTDLCPGKRAEIRVLKDALQYVPRLDSMVRASQQVLAGIAVSMAKDLGRDVDQCRWGIETWALALNKLPQNMSITPEEMPLSPLPPPPKPPVSRWFRAGIAASLLLVVGTATAGLYWKLHHESIARVILDRASAAKQLEEAHQKQLDEDYKKKIDEDNKKKQLEEDNKKKIDEDNNKKLEEAHKKQLDEDRKKKIEEDKKKQLEEDNNKKLEEAHKKQLNEDRKREVDRRRRQQKISALKMEIDGVNKRIHQLTISKADVEIRNLPGDLPGIKRALRDAEEKRTILTQQLNSIK